MKTGKSFFVLLLSVGIGISPLSAQSSDNGDGTFTNPVLWADVPDPDVIRVDDTFYMVSTTMHLMPGAPIMRSKDLVNWETVSYVFDRLTDTPKYDMKEGTVYGRGQWATSLRYHKGKFYAYFPPTTSLSKGIFIRRAIRQGSGNWWRVCLIFMTLLSCLMMTDVYMCFVRPEDCLN